MVTLYLIHSGQKTLTTEKYGGVFALIIFLSLYIYKLVNGVHSEGLLMGVIVVGITLVVVCIYEQIQKR